MAPRPSSCLTGSHKSSSGISGAVEKARGGIAAARLASFHKAAPRRQGLQAALERYAATRYGDVAKLAGVEPPEYRLRVGPWRVRFGWDQAAASMTVLHVFGRGQGYE